MSDFGSEGGGYVPSQSQSSAKSTMPGSPSLGSPFAGNSPMGGMGGMGGLGGASPAGKPTPPRNVGSIVEETVKRPAEDIVKEAKSFFDLNRLLGINPETDGPEQQAHKQQLHSKWQSMTQSEQQVAQQRYQQLAKQKQVAEQQKADSQRQNAQQQQLVMPTSTKKGAEGPGGGSRKKMMTQQLNQNRQSFNKTSSSG